MTRFRTLIADPPWRYSNRGTNGAAEKHYPTMTLDQLAALPVASLAHADSVLALWATWPLLPDALALIAHWGFAYVTGFPWVKLADPPTVDLFGELRAPLAFGTGFWVRGCTEPILIARRGKPPLPDRDFCGLISERFQHSRKPENLYHFCEALPGPYLELFARRARPGWERWGDQVDSTVSLPARRRSKPVKAASETETIAQTLQRYSAEAAQNRKDLCTTRS